MRINLNMCGSTSGLGDNIRETLPNVKLCHFPAKKEINKYLWSLEDTIQNIPCNPVSVN